MILPNLARLRRTLVAGVFASLLALAAHAAEATRNFDLPAGDAAQTLKQYAVQAQREIVFSAEAVGRVKTNPVSGALAPQEALDRLLANTGLVATRDAKSGAIAVKQAPPAPVEKNAQSRRENDAAADPAKSSSGQSQGGVIQLEKVEVTGSRIRSLVGDADINSIRTFSRMEIEESGVQSISDLRDLIPELSVARGGSSFTGNSSGTSVDGIMSFSLRGLVGNATLVLVDGRRLPRTRQSGVASDYDIYGIPVSAIERVEVMADGGSSVYGADAIGGVVNIILRKSFSLTEAEFSYENTWDKDAAVMRSSLTIGRRYGKLSLNIRANYEDQNAMAAVDRWWTATNDRRHIGGSDSRSAIPLGGRIRVASGVFPGTTTNVLAIPAGSDGKNVTAQDYINAGVPQDKDRYDSAKYTNLFNESRRQAYSFNAEYDFKSWLVPRVEVRWNEAINFGRGDPTGGVQSLTLPVGYPGNPFSTPIIVDKYYWEYGFQNRKYTTSDFTALAGISGMFLGDWRYAANIQYMKKRPELEESVNQLNPTVFTNLVNADPAYRPIIAHDSRVYSPNAAGVLEQIFILQPSAEPNWVWTYDARADGPVYNLPAGPVQVALGWEGRQDYVRFERQNSNDTTQTADQKSHRTTNSYFGELQVPVFGDKWNKPLLRSLKVSGSGRIDDYTDVGQGHTLAQGLSWRPFKWLLLAGNRNEGFKVPLLFEQYRNGSTSTSTFGTTGTFVLFDTVRNEQLIGTVRRFLGGNPNLKPERSESLTGRVVVEVPKIKGLSLEAKFWNTKIHDQVSTLTQYQDFFTLFPERFQRADPTPADIAAGKPGVINYIDNSPVNISLRQLAGIDYAVRYNRGTKNWGTFTFNATATSQTRNYSQIRPGGNNLTTVGLANRPLRASGTLSWRRGAYGASVTHIWQDGYRVSVLSGPDWPIYTQWNGSLSVDFQKTALAKRPGWVGKAFTRTRLTLAMINAFDEGLEISPTGGINPMLDPRLRRYTLTLRKAL